MTLFVVSLCVWISVAIATPDSTMLTNQSLAASPLIQSLLERVDMLEMKGLEQQEEIQTLKIEMAHQRGDMRKLRTKLKAKDKTIQSLLQILRISGGHETSKHTESPKQHSSDAIEERNPTRNMANRIRRAENEVTIAFSAGLTQDMLQVGNNQNIKFDQVITNIGNAYNPNHGLFTAPVPGVYVFSTSLLSYDSRKNWAYLMVNGQQKSVLFMHDDQHAMSSQTLVFDLSQGDVVAVQGQANDAFVGYLTPYTIFTGFLLQQNYTDTGSNLNGGFGGIVG